MRDEFPRQQDQTRGAALFVAEERLRLCAVPDGSKRKYPAAPTFAMFGPSRVQGKSRAKGVHPDLRFFLL
jgi:hypothetical protein